MRRRGEASSHWPEKFEKMVVCFLDWPANLQKRLIFSGGVGLFLVVLIKKKNLY
jgi:hypothetical protein